MKIYFIGQKGIPVLYGGVEKHVDDLATSLVKRGHEVYVYARANYTDKSLKEYQGVKIINLPSIYTKHLDAITHTFLACLDVVRRDADIIHFQSIGPSFMILLVRILKPKAKIVSTFHCQDYHHQKWNFLAQTFLKMSEYICCKFPDQVIVISKGLEEYADRRYKIRSVYIPNGIKIPTADYLQKIKNHPGLKQWGISKDNYILTVSRLIPHKGIHYLIKAYQRIKTDKKLVITGGGTFTDKYVKYLKKLATGNKNIIFTDVQSGEIIDALYYNSYFFVQPSESEGLSIALLNAMSFSRAALVSDIIENQEAIGNTGITFENKNDKDLAEKIFHLLNHPEIVKAKGEAGYERVKKVYNWDNLVKEVEGVYKKIAL
jgi:glycosyltransferase involved in cell wall biosynthesis